jgi:thiamine-monophosphate kinase
MSDAPGDGREPLEHALGDGEDFELVLAMPPDAARALRAAAAGPELDLPVTIIGEVTATSGLVAEDAAGRRSPLAPRGFVHAFDA